MVEYSARARREAELHAYAVEEHADPERHRLTTGSDELMPLNPRIQPVVAPAPGTGVVLVAESSEEWGPPSWEALWYGDEDSDTGLNCPVHHKAGVFEWAARQPAARHRVRFIGADEVPYEVTPPTNRKPDTGTGFLFIGLDDVTPIWVGAWADLGDGLDILADDDLRVVIEWAQRQPAAAKLIFSLGGFGWVDMDDFVADPERHLHR
ncbi:hypothetical protein [Actinopolymorpha alba]|uniref:hypothetical protein n=1 Tax=Actinopolymorpha alba TaxID=533267 RepID=UPI000369D437|nr:hypothetical protein [Actinopolymorpha alba]